MAENDFTQRCSICGEAIHADELHEAGGGTHSKCASKKQCDTAATKDEVIPDHAISSQWLESVGGKFSYGSWHFDPHGFWVEHKDGEWSIHQDTIPTMLVRNANRRHVLAALTLFGG